MICKATRSCVSAVKKGLHCKQFVAKHSPRLPQVGMRAMNGHRDVTEDLKPCNTFLQNRGTNVFSIMTSLSVEHSSVNLGQVSDVGFCTACWPRDEGLPLSTVSKTLLWYGIGLPRRGRSRRDEKKSRLGPTRTQQPVSTHAWSPRATAGRNCSFSQTGLDAVGGLLEALISLLKPF